ncbi:PAAR domain-containing protein [Pantoea sp.]|uniref:PAAR domain-containing protein n=1 Tax=Pantoea sp. TaxID=69393 RepID=UPI0028A9FA32|nr:PAAR domain-containing protein [Pantoea sp.]
MGMPAARASVDKAAHDGPIQCGSPDVIIGGFPAARKGDEFSCKQHGSGIIVSGSGSVFVNGMALARQGDKTQCHAGGASTPAKCKPAPPQYWGGSLAKKAGDDGMLHGEHYDARILGAYASLKDSTNDGSYDTVSAGFSLENLTMGNMKSHDFLRGEFRNKIADADATGAFYKGDSNIYGLNATAAAEGMQYGVTGAAGSEGTLYAYATGDVTIATADAKATVELYTGNKGRYGFNLGGGGGAAAVKEKLGTKVSLYGIVIAKTKVEAHLWAVGASAGAAAYFDETDYSFTLKANGRFALLLGLSSEVDLKVFLNPLIDLIIGKEDSSDDSEKGGRGDGAIISGCKTVLVGD